MKKQQALERLTSLENEAKELRKIIEAPDKSGITDRVKTFEDACNELSINPSQIIPTIESEYFNKDLVSVRAYMKLIIICRVLNEGWVPNWDDTNEYKYYPWFDMRSKSGVGFSYDACVGWLAGAHVGSRLCFKTRELAEYAGKQFESIYKEYLTIQK